VIRGARHVSLNATQIAWSISHKAETATPESSKQRNQPERSTEGTHRQGTRTPPPNRSRLSRSMTPRFIANQSSRRFPRERYAVLFSKNGREALDLFTKDDLLRSFLLGTCRTGEVWNRASAYVATSRTATAISSCLPATSNEELETGC
jgi:hypothetical protein